MLVFNRSALESISREHNSEPVGVSIELSPKGEFLGLKTLEAFSDFSTRVLLRLAEGLTPQEISERLSCTVDLVTEAAQSLGETLRQPRVLDQSWFELCNIASGFGLLSASVVLHESTEVVTVPFRAYLSKEES